MDHPVAQSESQKRTMRLFLLGCYLLAGLSVTAIIQSARRHPLSFVDAGIASWQQAIVIILALATVLMLFRRLRVWAVWEAMFTTTLFLGIWYAALLVFPLGIALAIASSVTIIQLSMPRVWTHDIFFLFGACGVAVSLSLWLPGEVLLVWLVAFSLYDILAGPPGGPIMELAGKLVGHGIVPGLVVVGRLRDLGLPMKVQALGRSALLGAGDLALPLALVARAAFAGTYQAVAVLSGLAVGVLFLSRGDMLHPRAALPALAAGACVPFIVLRLLSLI